MNKRVSTLLLLISCASAIQCLAIMAPASSLESSTPSQASTRAGGEHGVENPQSPQSKARSGRKPHSGGQAAAVSQKARNNNERAEPRSGAEIRQEDPRAQSRNHQPGMAAQSSQAAGQASRPSSNLASKTVTTQAQATSSALPARTPASAASAGGSRAEATHRGSNPPIVSGVATKRSVNTAAISGSAMHRKP